MSRGLGRDNLGTRQELLTHPTLAPASCPVSLHLSSRLHQPVPAGPWSLLSYLPHPSTHPSTSPSVCPPVCSQPSSEHPSSPSPMHHLWNNLPSKTLSPLSAGSLITRPPPTHPSPTPHLSPSSVSLSVPLSILTSFLHSPMGPAPHSPLCVPSITSQTALPSQVVTSWQLLCVYLSISPSIHPSAIPSIMPQPVVQTCHHSHIPWLDPLRCSQRALGRVCVCVCTDTHMLTSVDSSVTSDTHCVESRAEHEGTRDLDTALP